LSKQQLNLYKYYEQEKKQILTVMIRIKDSKVERSRYYHILLVLEISNINPKLIRDKYHFKIAYNHNILIRIKTLKHMQWKLNVKTLRTDRLVRYV